MAQMGSKGIALLFLSPRRLVKVGGQRHTLAAWPPRKTRVSTVQEAGWVSGPLGTVAKNLAPTGIRSPDRPASNE